VFHSDMQPLLILSGQTFTQLNIIIFLQSLFRRRTPETVLPTRNLPRLAYSPIIVKVQGSLIFSFKRAKNYTVLFPIKTNNVSQVYPDVLISLYLKFLYFILMFAYEAYDDHPESLIKMLAMIP